MRIQHNITALNANRNLTWNNNAVGKSLEKLSSGYRINRAGDDAAGLAVSEKMRAQISCLTQAETNCNDGISLIQTAEGALNEVHDMLNRMVELSEQSANGTYDQVDRDNLQAEVEQLKDEIDRISQATNFNGINLLDGSLGKTSGNTEGLNDLSFLGAAADNNFALVTKVSGAQVSADETVSVLDNPSTKSAADGGGHVSTTDILINTVNNRTGVNESVSIDLVDAITFTNGACAGMSFRDAKAATEGTANEVTQLKAGDTCRLDLTAGGLGVIEFTVTADTEVMDIIEHITVATDGTEGGSYLGGNGEVPTTDDGSGLTLQIGDTADKFNKLTVGVQSMSSTALGISGVNIATQDGASNAIETIKTAINTVSSTRGDLGAMQNRLEHTINNLSVTNENITNAESRIRDTDMAKEMMAYTSKNILSQAAQSMLAQANQQPQQVLSLLQ